MPGPGQHQRNRTASIPITPSQLYKAKLEFLRLGKYLKNLKCECFFGGGDPLTVNVDIMKMSKPQIVIGSLNLYSKLYHRTPGRMMDLVCRKKAIKLDKLKYFILDEADRMIDDLRMR